MTHSTIQLENSELAVEFSHKSDRFHHTIAMRYNDQFVPLMRSIEGDASEPWPSSPPLQQVVSESIANDGANVLLGVGLSGNGHWSIAVENKIAHEKESLVFDVACKNSKPANHLGSQYAFERCWQVTELLENAITLKHLELDRASVRMSVSIGSLKFDATNNGFQIVSLYEPAVLATHRWCYSIAMG